MIYADAFSKVASDVLQACVFLGASLSVNGAPQGEVTYFEATKADVYEFRLNGDNLTQLRESRYTCGTNIHGQRFVSVWVHCDYISVVIGQTVGDVYVETTDPAPACWWQGF